MADSTLSALTIGSLELTPSFDKDTMSYTATTTSATNKITAIASSALAEVEIKLGDTVIENEKSATWSSGVNNLTVKVTESGQSKTYTVAVTKN